MTDPQIFAFLVMPFLFVLTCSMVFVSSQNTRSQKPADPPKPVARPNSYARNPRQKRTAAK
jgi:Na+-transporting methylmalonyl-CoA/oxaloacetate decarboxylase gamma subunit